MPVMTMPEKAAYDLMVSKMAAYDAFLAKQSLYDEVVVEALRKGHETAYSITTGDFIPQLDNEPPKYFISPGHIAYLFTAAQTGEISYSWAIPPDVDQSTVTFTLIYSYNASLIENYRFVLSVQECVAGGIADASLNTSTLTLPTVNTSGQVRVFEDVFPFFALASLTKPIVTLKLKRTTPPTVPSAVDINVIGLRLDYKIL
jgi:hypothetical protein